MSISKRFFLLGSILLTTALLFTSSPKAAIAASLHTASNTHAASCTGNGDASGLGFHWTAVDTNTTVAQWTTCAGHTELMAYQTDNNLVLYCISSAGEHPIWNSNTDMGPFTAGELDFQFDGNLVVYDDLGEPKWASNTNNKNATDIDFQLDGNVVIYNSSSIELWATGTNGKC